MSTAAAIRSGWMEPKFKRGKIINQEEHVAEVKALEQRINKLKTKVAAQRKESAGKDAASFRETLKKLKRAQRRKRTLQARAAFIEAKGKKKQKKGAEGAAS